jgi:hypothetical protein
MRKALAVNAALAALALGTLGIVWATRDSATTRELAARQSKLLVEWNDAAITKISLRRGPARLELSRGSAADAFRIQKPWQEQADIATTKALVSSLELASALRPADGVTRQAAGLSEPSLEISLEMAGKTQILRLGGPAPAPPGSRYAEVVDARQKSRLFTVSQGLVDELDKPWDAYRETRLLELGRDDLAKLTIEGPGGRSELIRKDGAFLLSRPSGGSELADGEALDRVLTALTRIVSERFVEPEEARRALGPEAVRLLLEPKATGQGKVTLSVGGSCPGAAEQTLVLRERGGEQPRAACLPSEVGAALRVTPDQLELLRPFSASLDQVEELELRLGTQKLELGRKDGAFLLKLPTRSEVPLDAGNQRLGQIVGARGERVVLPNLAALGLTPAAGEATVRLASADSEHSRREVIALGKPRPDGSMCIKRETDGVVLCLKSEDVPAFQPDATLLRSLELTRFAASDLVSFSVETSGLRERVRRKPDGGYELEEPPGFRHDGALVTDAVQLLGALRAERWAAGQAVAAHGLAAPRLRVTLELAADQRRELVVGAATSSGYFATISSEPGVFVLSRSSVQQLEQPLLERSLCPVPAADLQRIELGQPGREIVLTRSGETWQASGPAAPRAHELGEVLSGLRAEQALHLGPARPNEGLAQPSMSVRFVDNRGQARKLTIGARDTWQGASIAYARLEGVNATFALAAATLTALQDF